ncbi:hypothetical protein FRC02_010191, partial [Tulasnella sp. 418]
MNHVRSPSQTLSGLESTSRSPDATPVPTNPNHRLSTSIPSLSMASRRLATSPVTSRQASAPPISFRTPNSSFTSNPSTSASQTSNRVGGSTKGAGKSTRPSLSTTGSSRTQRTKSLNTPATTAPSVKGSTRAPSVRQKSAPSIASSRNVKPTSTKPAPSPSIKKGDPPKAVPKVTTPAKEVSTTVDLSTPPKNAKSSATPPLFASAKSDSPHNFESPRQSKPQSDTLKATNPILTLTPMKTPNGKAAASPRTSIETSKPTPQQSPMSSPLRKTPGRPNYPLTSTPKRPGGASPVPGVPWNSSGVLGNSPHIPKINGSSPAQRASQSPTNHFLHPPPSLDGDPWSGGESSYASKSMGPGIYGDDDYDGPYEESQSAVMTLEMLTEVDENEMDEDLQLAFDDLQKLFMKKLIHYRRLLEQAQASSASQLHALQAELRLLRLQIEEERQATRDLEIRAGKDREALVVERRNRTKLLADASVSGGGSFDIISSFRGDGQGSFDEAEVRKVVRSLRMSDRMRLIHLILDFEVVSKTWQNVVHHPSIWRRLCLQLTWSDPVPLRWPEDTSEWEPLYKSLHHREANWATGTAQSLRFLRGHTGFCTTLILKGNRLISGSYDETIRVWDVRKGKETHCLKAKAISCLDFLPEEEVLVAGYHDVGRVQVYSTVTWALLQTLQGHLYGIRSVAMSSKYVVSAGADKALVCWDWRAGQKIVRFGQQTNLNIGVQIVDDDTMVGITIDGIVRTFSIRRQEMISQFKLNDLALEYPSLSSRLAHVGVGPNNMLQWFAAKGKQMTCATKSVIIHLEWTDREDLDPDSSIASKTSDLAPGSPAGNPRRSIGRSRSSLATATPPRKPDLNGSGGPRPSLSKSTTSPRIGRNDRKVATVAPPKLLAVIDTPDIAVGAVDPLKRRVATATRFSSRLGADRRIFVSTYRENLKSESAGDDSETPSSASSVNQTLNEITSLGGAWAEYADGIPEDPIEVIPVPADFKGLATPGMNPMSMALSHEEVVIGCADGTIYIMSF